MNAEHSPGPLTVVETTGSELLIIAGKFPGPNHHTIAIVSDPRFTAAKPFPEDYANANLFAAAPEMLVALRDAKALLEHFGKWCYNPTGGMMGRTCAKIEDAIAKA